MDYYKYKYLKYKKKLRGGSIDKHWLEILQYQKKLKETAYQEKQKAVIEAREKRNHMHQFDRLNQYQPDCDINVGIKMMKEKSEEMSPINATDLIINDEEERVLNNIPMDERRCKDMNDRVKNTPEAITELDYPEPDEENVYAKRAELKYLKGVMDYRRTEFFEKKGCIYKPNNNKCVNNNIKEKTKCRIANCIDFK
jgi:hypothetical protein